MLSVVLPLAIVCIKRNQLVTFQRSIGVLVAVTFISEIIVYVPTFFEIGNLPMLHLFTVLQFVLLANIMRKVLVPLISNRTLNILMMAFILFASIDALFLNGIDNFNSYSRPLASFILVFLALCYFYKTLKELKVKSLDKEPLFWLHIGILIYFSGSFFIFLFTNYIKTSNDALFTLWGIHAIFNIFLNISYAIALWIQPTN